MPGLISAFSIGNAPYKHTAHNVVAKVSSAMYGGMNQVNSSIYDFAGGKMAVCARHNLREKYHFFENDAAIMFLIGRPGLNGQPFASQFTKDNVPTSDEQLASFAHELTGHFHIVHFNKLTGTFSTVTDIMSSFPCYTLMFDNTVILTPEALSLNSLKSLGWTPAIRKSAIYEMLSSTNLTFEGTYWKDVFKLLPATLTSWNDAGTIKSSRFFTFPSLRQCKESDLCEQLYSNIRKDIGSVPQGKYILSLSGGYDSRALLAYMHTNKIPASAISYDFGHIFKSGFDLEVGEYFSQKTDITFSKFHVDPTNSEQLIDGLNSVILSTGGEVDATISQCGFLGKEFFCWLHEKGDTLFRGDEMWGRGDPVTTAGTAFWRNSMFKIQDILQNSRIMREDAYNEAVEYTLNLRQKIMHQNKEVSAKPNSLKDFLAWINREGRVVQSIGYHNRCHIDQQSPFVFGNSMKMCASLPWKWRIKKRLFRKTMEQYHPEFFLDKMAPTKKAPLVHATKQAMSQPSFHEFARELLVDNPSDVFSECFDKKAIENVVSSVAAAQNDVLAVKSYNLLTSQDCRISRFDAA